MTGPALFELDERPLRELVAREIMPAAFGTAAWAADARRRTYDLTDRILAIAADHREEL